MTQVYVSLHMDYLYILFCEMLLEVFRPFKKNWVNCLFLSLVYKHSLYIPGKSLLLVLYIVDMFSPFTSFIFYSFNDVFW